MHAAAKYGQVKSIGALVQHGADVNKATRVRDAHAQPRAIVAVQYCNCHVVVVMLIGVTPVVWCTCRTAGLRCTLQLKKASWSALMRWCGMARIATEPQRRVWCHCSDVGQWCDEMAIVAGLMGRMGGLRRRWQRTWDTRRVVMRWYDMAPV